MEGGDPINGKEENTRPWINGGFSEKKNEKVIVNMVMAITTRSKAPKEVAF
jgi:hypothetical protein